MSRRGKATIPSRIAIVQRTLPHYRVPTFDALMRIAAPGSVLLHGNLKSTLQPKQTAFDGHVSFSRRALPAWFMHLRIRGKLFFPVFMPGLYRALAETNPDVILTEGESNLLNDLVVARYAKRAGVPYVWWGLGAILALDSVGDLVRQPLRHIELNGNRPQPGVRAGSCSPTPARIGSCNLSRDGR